MAEDPDYIIQSVVKALKTLKQFSAEEKQLTMTELSKRTGINKSNMLRILTSLESENFVKFNDETKKYQLGIAMYNLGNTAFGFLDVKKICYPILREASTDAQVLIHLAVEQDGKVLVIDRIWPNYHEDIAGLVSQIGGNVPTHCTGVGKVLAAYSSSDRLQKMLAACKFERHSERTITDKEMFLKELAKVKAQGFALNDGENEDYLRCITRPVFDGNGKLVAAFSLSGLRTVMDDEHLPYYQDVSKRVALELCKEFGC